MITTRPCRVLDRPVRVFYGQAKLDSYDWCNNMPLRNGYCFTIDVRPRGEDFLVEHSRRCLGRMNAKHYSAICDGTHMPYGRRTRGPVFHRIRVVYRLDHILIEPPTKSK